MFFISFREPLQILPSYAGAAFSNCTAYPNGAAASPQYAGISDIPNKPGSLLFPFPGSRPIWRKSADDCSPNTVLYDKTPYLLLSAMQKKTFILSQRRSIIQLVLCIPEYDTLPARFETGGFLQTAAAVPGCHSDHRVRKSRPYFFTHPGSLSFYRMLYFQEDKKKDGSFFANCRLIGFILVCATPRRCWKRLQALHTAQASRFLLLAPAQHTLPAALQIPPRTLWRQFCFPEC